MINVTAAIIERAGPIFLAKRFTTDSLPNKWEFPSGKVEAGESPEECFARELLEEFNIIVTFTGFHYEGLDGVFPSATADEIVNILEQINSNAEVRAVA